MLFQFLRDNREQILAKTRRKTDAVSEEKPTTAESERGLPQFYDYLTGELERASQGLPKAPEREEGPDTTAKHGKELKRLGYTVSQVVQGYGVLAQAITEATLSARAPATAEESKTLNHTLDLAIAEAVTAFAKRVESQDCAKKIGTLSHELRNALAAASIARSMGRRDGGGERLESLLDRNLARMREILDRSFSELRLQNEKEPERCPVVLLDIAEEVEATASEEARSRGMTMDVDVDPGIELLTDAHYLISALSNIVQNAIKYTRPGGGIWIRGRLVGADIRLEVEDRCGGLPSGKAEELFKPFVQKGEDRTGLGLGLSISRQAVDRIGGSLSVRDLPAVGCVFLISLPKSPRPWKQPRRADPAGRPSSAQARRSAGRTWTTSSSIFTVARRSWAVGPRFRMM